MSGSNADVNKMRAEEVRSHGTADGGPKRKPGGVLHQRRSLPFNPTTMAVGGFLIVATIGYLTLYSKSKPGTTPTDVAKLVTGTDDRARRAK